MSMKPGRKFPIKAEKYRHRPSRTPITLVPASQLDSMSIWRNRAEALGNDGMLMVIPVGNRHLEAASERIRVVRSQHGRRVLIFRLH